MLGVLSRPQGLGLCIEAEQTGPVSRSQPACKHGQAGRRTCTSILHEGGCSMCRHVALLLRMVLVSVMMMVATLWRLLLMLMTVMGAGLW